jgi:hypothetical protein
MCLFFYLSGVFTGYLTWRLVNAPRLWDAEEEAKNWQKQWLVLKEQNDTILGRDD